MDTTKLTDAEYTTHMEERMAFYEADYVWTTFRDAVKPLCCREKLRPKHWQRAFFEFFASQCTYAVIRAYLARCRSEGTEPTLKFDSPPTPEDGARISRAIEAMMQASRPWCNPQLFDEAGARGALKTALDAILPAQDLTSTGVPPVDDGQLSKPVDVPARTEALARECL
jgi:hypothetical protein